MPMWLGEYKMQCVSNLMVCAETELYHPNGSCGVVCVALWQVALKAVGSNPTKVCAFFGPGQLLPRAEGAMDPVGSLGPHR